MSDPSYVQMLQDLSKDPGNAMKHMADPRMQATLQGNTIFFLFLLVLCSVLFGVNIGTDAEGNASASFEEPKKEPEKPKMSMDDMDTSGPSEPKQKKQEDLVEDPIDDDKEEAKREKEKGNQFYKKKDFDNAIMHYDNVSLEKGLLFTSLGYQLGPREHGLLQQQGRCLC